MTEVEELFLSTLDDLRRRVKSHDPYEILGASALIRKLLIDGSPLADQVNRTRRLKLRFRIGLPLERPAGFPEPVFWSQQDGIDPETAAPGHRIVAVTRDELLGATVLKVSGEASTLREVVLFEANIMGGVHAGSPREQQEKVLVQLNRTFAVGGYRVSLRQLKAIGRVVIAGLQPLRAEVERGGRR